VAHTPGPWVWHKDDMHDGWSGLFGPNDEPVLWPQRENDGDDGDAWFASVEDAGEEGLSDDDRALIAAATDTLAALRQVRPLLMYIKEHGWGLHAAAMAQRVLTAADTAIAKAEGNR